MKTNFNTLGPTKFMVDLGLEKINSRTKLKNYFFDMQYKGKKFCYILFYIKEKIIFSKFQEKGLVFMFFTTKHYP